MCYDYRGDNSMKKYFNYEVYSNGTVKRNGKELKWNLNSKGYPRVTISNGGKSRQVFVHKLVAMLYIPNKSEFKCLPKEDRTKIDLNKLQVNHIDGNKLNNNVKNLEWCTNLYNRRHAIENNLAIKPLKGDENSKAKKVRMNGNGIELIFGSLRSALDYLGKPYSCYSSIAHCCKGDTKTAYGYKWEYVEK